MNCQVKSKYLGIWQSRELKLNRQKHCFELHKGDFQKKLPLDSLKYNRIKANQLQIKVNDRTYLIKFHKQKDTYFFTQVFEQWHIIKKLNKFHENTVPIPTIIKYQQQKQKDKDSLLDKQKLQLEIETQNFIKFQDWEVDQKDGGLKYINKQKKAKQIQIIKYVISRVIKTGSFMGISFPVFSMKPQSMLQTYCKCFSMAPSLLCQKDSIQRMKMFICNILVFSLRFTDLDKSFNPVIGQTYQGSIGNCKVYAEQTSHHPPISSFLIVSKQFKLYGSMELNARLGLNTARGMFYGDIVVQYNDRTIIRGCIPNGILSGLLYGKDYFIPYGAAYAYDKSHNLVCSYEVTEKDILRGYIGQLKQKSYDKFMKMMTSNDESTIKKKYEQFQHLSQNKFKSIHSHLECVWSQKITFDQQVYINYNNSNQMPPTINQKQLNYILPSDSTFRKDIALLKEGKIDQAQLYKQNMEDQERRCKKLRDNYSK